MITRVFATLAAIVVAMFVATPALANEPYAASSQFSAAGEPLQIVPISIVMIVLLFVVLAVSTAIGNLFEKKD